MVLLKRVKMILKQRLPRAIFIIAIILFTTFFLGYFVFANKQGLPVLDDFDEDIFSAWKIGSTGKQVITSDFLEIFIDGKSNHIKKILLDIIKVINATHNYKKVHYNESKAFCASKNLTLPRTPFIIIETGYESKSIFWIADNEETRKAANEKNREHLDVAVYPKSGGRDICAALVSEIHNPGLPVLFLCEEEVFDISGRLIWHINFTAGCDVFKCNKTFIIENDAFDLSDHVIRDHTDGTVVASKKLTGYQKGTFSAEETGIEWCEGQPAVLSPANRMRDKDCALVQGFTYSTAATICLPNDY